MICDLIFEVEACGPVVTERGVVDTCGIDSSRESVDVESLPCEVVEVDTVVVAEVGGDEVFVGQVDAERSLADRRLVVRCEPCGSILREMLIGMVAMLIEVGRGKITKEDLIEIMDAKNRKKAPKIAPANALYLVNIKY